MLVTEPHPALVDVVAAAVRGGVSVVQIRDKTAGLVELTATALDLWDVTQAPVLLIVNGASVYTVRKSADGMQLSMAACREVPASQGQWLTGVSVHSAAEAREAEQWGADYLVAGTVYASQSHPDIAPQGLGYLQDVCASVTVPVLAIGGITPARVAECVAAGAAGVAVLSPIMRAADPEAMARDYRYALDTAWKTTPCT